MRKWKGFNRDFVAWVDFQKTGGWGDGTDKSVPFQSAKSNHRSFDSLSLLRMTSNFDAALRVAQDDKQFG
jgi:hypothetical protein